MFRNIRKTKTARLLVLALILAVTMTGVLMPLSIGAAESAGAQNEGAQSAESQSAAKSTAAVSAENDEYCIKDSGIDSLEGKIAGVMTGTPQDEIIKKKLPNVELLYFNNATDMTLALDQGKIDFFALSSVNYYSMKETHPELAYISESFTTFDIGTVFPKTDEGQKLCDELNKYIKKISDSGELKKLQDYWLFPNDWEDIDIPTTGENGVLKMATAATLMPFSFIQDGKYAGFDMAIIAGFCREAGYGLQIENVDMSGALTGISTGKYDLAAGQISWTEERAKSVIYSDTYYTQSIVPIVRAEDYGLEPGQSSGAGADGESELEFSCIDELQDEVTFGIVSGTTMDDIVKENFPNAEIMYFQSVVDEAMALESGKIDAVIFDEPVLSYLNNQFDDLGIIPELVAKEDYYFITNKGDFGSALQAEFNEWLAGAKADGIVDEKIAYWTSDTEVTDPVDCSDLTGEKGTLQISYTTGSRPELYLVNGKPAGYCADLIVEFCRDRGYGIEWTDISFDAFLPNLASGKSDMYVGFISYTDERAESVLYTDSVYSGGIAVMVRKAGAAVGAAGDDSSFWDKVKTSFRRTLVDEDRYKMILAGLGKTLIITLFGFILANLLGILFCAMSMSRYRILKLLADIYSRLMQGLPLVVILMILYYVIFGNVNIAGTIVAIVGFGMTSGSALAQTFEGSVGGVDKGQIEASLAIGFTGFETFKGIVLPQAIRSMLPGYFSELIGLMKGTAIVGYIAVVDLTKTGDIIRSSTYEAFFPLITVALIYFAISVLLISIMKIIKKKLAPKRIQAKGGVK